MYVTNLAVSSIAYDQRTDRYQGCVELAFHYQGEERERQARFVCHTRLCPQAPRAQIIAGLLEDVRKQVLELPEYRLGMRVFQMRPEVAAQPDVRAA